MQTSRKLTEPRDRKRSATNAVLNARRALSCLVDEFLVRDAFNLCKDAPSEADRKAELLRRRGIFDALANSTLRRAIDRRNLVEHKYESLPLAEAEELVQVVRASIEATVARHRLYEGSALVGTILGGHSLDRPDQTRFWFSGWSGVAFVIVREFQPAWFGVVVPSSDEDAVVRKVELRDVTCDVWHEVLTTLEQAPVSSVQSADLWLGGLKAAGLVQG